MAHDPAWPDKAMFAAYLLMIGGFLGLGMELVRLAGGTVITKLPPDLAAYPQWLSALAAAIALVMGAICLRTQAAVFGHVGVAAGLFSLAYGGLVPFVSLLALAMLVRSRIEGEETRNDGIKLHTGLWPDKAMGASLFMVVGGAAILFQGAWIALDRYEPFVLAPGPTAIVVDVAAGLFCCYAAWQVYHLRRSWLGELAAAVCIATLALVVIGPAIGIVILGLMMMARREDEFDLQGPAPVPAGSPEAPAPPARARRPAKAGRALGAKMGRPLKAGKPRKAKPS